MRRSIINAALTYVVLASALAACVDGPAVDVNDDTSEASSDLSSDVYNAFTGTSSTGPVSKYAWQGYKTSYPSGDENFRTYSLPTTVECSSSKSTRSWLDVTAGCLTAVNVGGYSRGKISTTSDGAFRAVAHAFTGSETNPLKWTDMANEYRFYYTGSSGVGTDPGFKAFIRYRTEDDLYAASWRFDGIIQIKRKYGGTYKLLAQRTMSKPSTYNWHTLKFTAVGDRLDLYLDGTKVLTAYDTTFAWGTAGIRTDATNGAYLDEWKISAP